MLPSVKVPIAENCSVVCFAIDALPGVTAKATMVAAVTLTLAVPVTEPCDANTRAVPFFIPESSPLPLTLAMDGAEEVQLTDPVKSCVLPSW